MLSGHRNGTLSSRQCKEWIRALNKLGFEERRVGRGKHVNKFTHPIRYTQDSRIQRDFIIIPHKVLSGPFNTYRKRINAFRFLWMK